MDASSVVIRSKFGTKSVGRYIRQYTSREEATESLPLKNYVLEYAARKSATEQLQAQVATVNEVERTDTAIMGKNGVAFGNHGLSYSNDELEQAAKVSQRAANDGHTVILPIISFKHEYLIEKGIVPKTMDEPKKRGDYRGQVDQLKLRRAITGMMTKWMRDYHFDQPEWTGCIQVDTLHVHCHLTLVETGRMADKDKRLVRSFDRQQVPKMQWQAGFTTDDIQRQRYDQEQRLQYLNKNGELIAQQRLNRAGMPAFTTKRTPRLNADGSEKMILVENGMLSQPEKAILTKRLDRELSLTAQLHPIVADITNARTQTKELAAEVVLSDQKLAHKLQILQASLPANKRLWRAGSHAKSMERPNDIANSVVDDLWTAYGDDVDLGHFDQVVDVYAQTRQNRERLSDAQTEQLRETARGRLREEMINQLYRQCAQIKPEQQISVPASVKPASLSDDELKATVVADFHTGRTSEVGQFAQIELRQRSYYGRLDNAMEGVRDLGQQIEEFDQLKRLGKTAQAADAVRDYLQIEYDYQTARQDKYNFLLHGRKSGVSQARFEVVRDCDLVDVTYDFGPTVDRRLSQERAQRYLKQIQTRQVAWQKMQQYLQATGQVERATGLQQDARILTQTHNFAANLTQSKTLPTPKAVYATDRFPKALTIDDSIELARQQVKVSAQVTETFEQQFIDETVELGAVPALTSRHHRKRSRAAINLEEREAQLAAKRQQWQEQQAQWARERQVLDQVSRWQEQQTQQLISAQNKNVKERQQNIANKQQQRPSWLQQPFPERYFHEPEVQRPSGFTANQYLRPSSVDVERS